MRNNLDSGIIIELTAVIILITIAILIIINMAKGSVNDRDIRMRWCLQQYYSYEYCKERYGE